MTSLSDKNWEAGWTKGYEDDFKDAIDKILYLLKKGRIKDIYEEVYHGCYRK